MTITLQYHLFIVTALTLLAGTVVKKRLFKNASPGPGIDRYVPYAMSFLPISLAYAFSVNELPLTGFALEPAHNSSLVLGPQSVNGDAMLSVILLITSLFLHLAVWLFALYVVTGHFLKRRRKRQTDMWS